MKYRFYSMLFVSVGLCQVGFGSLSDSALLSRCFKDLTGQVILPTHQVAVDVRNGTRDPITVCMNLLKSSQFSGDRLPQSNNFIQKSILKRFSNIHNEWFINRTTDSLDSVTRLGMGDVAEMNLGSLFVTRSLFKSDLPYKSVLNQNYILEGIRTGGEPTVGTVSRRSKSEYLLTPTVVWPGLTFAQIGDLVGIKPARALTIPTQSLGNISFLKTVGGGVLGSETYLSQNVVESFGYNSDGGVIMQRKLSKAVMKDFLCKELPAIRYSDASPYVRPNSSVPFRRAKTCTQCHATMDRMAGVFRNHRARVSGAVPGKPRVYMLDMFSPTRGSMDWPDEPVENYYQYEPTGYLYFRSYNGELVHEAVKGFNELGSAVTETKDFYACAAKRYYKTFTGIHVNLDDIFDPANPIELNANQEFHRKFVIKLGEELSNHQDLFKTIQSIFESKTYKHKNNLSRVLASELPLEELEDGL